MACRLPLSELDLSCPICCDVFRKPVVLKCSHSFCESCLERYWDRNKPRRDCPLCRHETQDAPVHSLTLRNLCDSLIQESEEMEEREEELRRREEERGEESAEDMCPFHSEKLKLFCVEDKQPICVVCHTSRKHKQHQSCPISEALEEAKNKMQSALELVQKRRAAFESMKKVYDDSEAHIQFQAQLVERRTHEEFQILHSFLEAEEEARKEALRREEEVKTQAVREKSQEMSQNIQALSERITELQENMASQGVSMLYNCQSIIDSALSSSADPVLASGLLIDSAKHLGSLKYHVWRKMKEIVTYTPVTFDPNCSAPWLRLSDDLTSVQYSEQRRELPDVPERFDPEYAVLGSEGFSSGTHGWDVSVGGAKAWVVGVAKASVRRKEKESSVLKNGYLSVYFYHDMYFAGTTPLTRLSLKRALQKVRVLLDCDRGRVGFYDARDNTHLHTFRHALEEEVFPYVWVGCPESPLKIEPSNISVQVQDVFCPI